MANHFQIITPDFKTETWAFGDPDYDKYIIEGELDDGRIGYEVLHNHPSKEWYKSKDTVEESAEEMTQTEYNTYFARIGGHPPTKPPAA